MTQKLFICGCVRERGLRNQIMNPNKKKLKKKKSNITLKYMAKH